MKRKNKMVNNNNNNPKHEQEIEEGNKPTEVNTGGLHDQNEVNFDSTQITNPEQPTQPPTQPDSPNQFAQD